MRREWSYSTKNLEEAMDYAWENKLTMIVYPVDMNLILVDNFSEEDVVYLKYAYVLDANEFKDIDDFAEYIATTIIGG